MKKLWTAIFILVAPAGYFASPPAKPSLLGESVISTRDDEFGATLSPDGNTCFFTKRSASTIQSSTYVICVSYLHNNKWSEPAIAPFSGKYKDFNPMFSPDGNSLFFISNRVSATKRKTDGDIWVVKKTGNGWTQPENLGGPINTAAWELGCSAAANGNLYFCSTGTTGNPSIYCSRKVNGVYQQPDTLPKTINGDYPVTDPFIAPDESYLLFTAQYRADAITGPGADSSYPRKDICISFKKDGQWQKAKRLDAPVNSIANESNPSVSSDGKTLFFTSERSFVTIPMSTKLTYPVLEKKLHQVQNGLGDIYQVSADILATYQ